MADRRSAAGSWADGSGCTDAQVRKDLAHFGQFGRPGIGYRCDELIGAIRRILGTDRQWQVALVGAGHLGQALLGYRGFSQQGFRIVAAFDSDETKAGTQMAGIEVHPMSRLAAVVASEGIQIAVLAVPAPHAQAVADQLVEVGVSGIMNFAPISLRLPREVSIVGVDLAKELEQVTFSVANRIPRS